MYQLTQKALTAINEARPEKVIRLLMDALDCSEATINRHVRDNIPNGDLTKVAAMEVIREVTGLKDAQILERVKEKVEA